MKLIQLANIGSLLWPAVYAASTTWRNVYGHMIFLYIHCVVNRVWEVGEMRTTVPLEKHINIHSSTISHHINWSQHITSIVCGSLNVAVNERQRGREGKKEINVIKYLNDAFIVYVGVLN